MFAISTEKVPNSSKSFASVSTVVVLYHQKLYKLFFTTVKILQRINNAALSK